MMEKRGKVHTPITWTFLCYDVEKINGKTVIKVLVL